ncbi:MAG TPA: DUF3618 domain-containing protein [Allosphingosinicella sp.]|nr:DUF3618 domain-containing protein [Allosphingosinicella sp.]
MTDNTNTEDPARIEADIRRTQEDMSRTVDRIGDQFTVRNIFNALLDKADESDVDARMLIDGARRNPIALGLIAAGAIWLVSDKDSKFPTIKSSGKRERWESDDTDVDVYHRDYVSHMSSVEMNESEDPIAYQRRRDLARANFLMIERGHEEDDQSFRRRLDDMTEKFREKRRAWSDSASQSGRATKEKGRKALARAQDLYDRNPLVGGIIAAAAGAAFGSSLPVSRQEQEKLGGVGAKARDLASEQTDRLTSQAREKKDELVRKADEKLQPTDSSGTATSNEPSQQREAPFMIGDGPR